MVKMSVTYTGGLHCELTHGPSGSRIETDAPKDNQGRGERFSPTDLMGAALASCILTTMAIVAERDGVSILGARAETEKEMIAQPRRVGSLRTKVTLPAAIPADYRTKLERAAEHCPVHKSLHPDIDAGIRFVYEE
jgi:putative redox protein